MTELGASDATSKSEAASDAPLSVAYPQHEVYQALEGWAYYCTAWHTAWTFRTQGQADYFLAAHLLYPVAPCTGPQAETG